MQVFRPLFAVLFAASLTLAVGPALCGRGQANKKLTLDQVEQLIRIGAPDTTVAGEIRRSGLDFVPTKQTVETLRGLGAGSQTIQAIDQLRPMLDEAKREIPGILTEIYRALDQGNWQAVRPSLSSELASNSQKLDSICKPFTYRAHYIESVVERPERQFEVRVRVLFKPVDEHAYVLVFRSAQNRFTLQDISEPPSDWFGAELSAAGELTRRFVYAIKAGRQDILAQSVSPGVNTSGFTTDPCWQLLLGDVNQVQVGQVKLTSHKGLKASVAANLPGSFLVEPIDGDYKIVSAFSGIDTATYFFMDRDGKCRDTRSHFRSAEDPGLESYTLKRFGLLTSSTASATDKSAGGSVAASVSPVCGDYASCMKGATTSLQAWQWSEALLKFQQASVLDPSKGDPWAGMGDADFQLGRYDDAFGMWDKALEKGAALAVSTIHAHIVNGDKGIFHLSVKEVSFVNEKGEQELVGTPTAVTSEGPVFYSTAHPAYYVQLHASGKNYRFYYAPKNMRCYAGFASCPEPGLAQQKVFADYIHRTLVKIGAGDFGLTASKP